MGVFSFGPFTYHSRTAELYKDGRRIKLHPQPAQVLQLLLSRAGALVSRRDIKNELWSVSTYVDFELGINSCIRQIRSALGEDAENPDYVQTIPRRGYRFIAPVEEKSSRSDREKPKSIPAGFGRRNVPSALFLGLFTLAAVWVLRYASTESRSPTVEETLSVAVLPADNLSGDATLDWLRHGLTDLLVTELSLHTNLDVLPMDRIHETLDDLNESRRAEASVEIVEKVIAKTDVDAVLLCSFLRSGDRLRVNARLQDAATGEILWTDKAEAADDDVFPVVDRLSRHIRAKFGVSSMSEPHAGLRLEDVTTSSMEAYQLYSEGQKFHADGNLIGAAALLEKAVTLDPEFALALGRLSAVHAHLGHTTLSEAYAKKAFDHRNKLSPLERFYIEGLYYGLREESYELAIDNLRKAIQLEPHLPTARRDLGAHYLHLERYNEALVHLETHQRHEDTFAGITRLTAMAYQAMGYMEKAYDVSRSYIEKHPDKPHGYLCLGFSLTAAGELDQACFNFQKAQSLAVGNFVAKEGIWGVLALRDRWNEADELAREMDSSTDGSIKSTAMSLLAVSSLYHGRYREALQLIDRAVANHAAAGTSTAALYNLAAQMQLAVGNAAHALALAERAQNEGRGHFPEWQGLTIAALAQAKLGRLDEAHKTANELLERTKKIPTKKETRRYHVLLGKLAFLKGEADRAIEELDRAVLLLPARGLYAPLRSGTPPHVFIWCSLARAYLEAGDDRRALQYYRRISQVGTERLWWPIQYVRSFYFQGKIYQHQGDMEKAREHYRRFYEYWKDGDFDRNRVEEARRFLGSV